MPTCAGPTERDPLSNQQVLAIWGTRCFILLNRKPARLKLDYGQGNTQSPSPSLPLHLSPSPFPSLLPSFSPPLLFTVWL